MIPILLSTALVFYSAVLGLFIVGIWAFTEVSVRRSYFILEKQYLWRCLFCGYIYLDQEAEAISKCPRCESYNSVEDKHARFVRVRPVYKEDEGEGELRRNTSHRKRPHMRRRGPRKRS